MSVTIPVIAADGAKSSVTMADPVVQAASTPTLTAVNVTSTGAMLAWTPANATVTQVGRDGVDATGYGAWSGLPTALPFANLVPDTTYNLFAVVNGTKLTVQAQTAKKPPPPPPPPPSTGKWLSGVCIDPGTMAAFETWRGRQSDFYVTFAARDSWASLLNPWWLYRVRPAQRINIGVPLWPQNSDVKTNADAQWKQFAGLLQAGDVVRLGWEMNGNWFFWQITPSNRAAWKAAYIRAYNAIKSVNPGIIINLCLGEGPASSGVANADIVSDMAGYFDLLGCDFYWFYGVQDTEASWTTRINRDGGLAWNLAKAQALGVKISVGEWGVTTVANNGTGDSAFFVQHFLNWYATNAAYVHSENYFDVTDYVIYPGNAFPKAAAAYKAIISAMPS